MISVLYVDDEPALLDIGKIFLEQSGSISVDTCSSAAFAQKRLAERSYDAIVSDYQMPMIDGIEFLKYVRNQHNDLPFILFTGRGREEVVIEALNLGADFYLQKGGNPVPQFAELVHKIKQAVRNKRSEQRVNESEERYRTLFEKASDAIFMVERGVFIDCNTQALEFFGCTREQLIGSCPGDYSSVIHPDGCQHAEKSSGFLDDILMGESGISEWRYQRKDGRVFNVEINLTRLDTKENDLVLAVIRDASERKLVEEALRESAQIMTDIISFLPDATFAINTDGRVIAWNRAMEVMTGISAGAIIGKGDYEYSLPFYGERRPALIDLILTRDKTISAFYTTIEEHGSNLVSEIFIPGLNSGCGAHLWFTASPLIDSHGNIIGAIESIRDITARKNRETELRASYEQIAAMEEELRNNYEELASREKIVAESEANYKALFSAMVEGHAVNEMVYDPHGVPVDYRILQANPAFEKIFGISCVNAVGRMSRDVFGIDEPRALARFADVVRTGIPQSLEFWYPPMKKHLAISIYSPRKGIFATVFEDITDRKQKDDELRAAYEQIAAVEEELRSNFEDLAAQERALRTSEEHYRQIVETAQEGIWSMDQGLKATFANPRLAEMLGYSPDEILGRPVADFIHNDDLVNHAEMMLVRQSGARSAYERKFSKKDGTPLWCQVSATPLLDAWGKFQGSFAMLTDITARNIARQELEEKNMELNAANEQMAAAFEELKATEESLIQGNRELEEQREALQKSEQGLKIANQKLNLLSGLTRHDVVNQLTALSGYVELSAQYAQDPQFRQMIEKEQKLIEMINQQIQFTEEYEGMGVNAPVWQDIGATATKAAAGLDMSTVSLKIVSDNFEIYADPLLGKAFYNLMDNTLRYGKTVSEIMVSCERKENALVITYSDNGAGIDAEARPHLFERGYGKHTGLGLFFTREVLGITGLSITETGSPGKGVRFEITVPDGEYRITDTRLPSS